MTEEEINKKAEKHCNEVLCNAHEKCNEVIKCRDWRSRRAGFFCGYEQALKDFEKENAELKHTIATLRQEKDNVSMHAKAMEVVAKTRSDQLTKSKELLERFLNVGDLWELDGNAFLKLQSDVTQFLKDSEVEK